MTQLSHPNKKKTPFLVKTLSLAIAAHMFASGYSHAGPEGGVVVGGTGDIVDMNNTTRIDQSTQRLSLEWNSFDVATDERVEFVQPNAKAIALNRILDNNGSRILGQIDANGRVILMNPNGIMFGEDATVNVGGLVASGLNIDSTDFMNGKLIFSGVEDTSGIVVNRGLINAATGGSVALLGKSVANHGLISAKLGHIALAAGSEAVVTFDDQGLIGVRINKETLASEVDGDYAVDNGGALEAEGGNILLNASVSADLFSKAVNNGAMGGKKGAVVHDDGSFTLGAGNSAANTGLVTVSSPSGAEHDAGSVVMAGKTVDQHDAVRANAVDSNRAGKVTLVATESVNLGAASIIDSTAPEGNSGKVSVRADSIVATEDALIQTSGNTKLVAQENSTIPQVSTHNLYLQGLGDVNQAGKIESSGETELVIVGANIDLTDSDNDFNTLALDARYNANVQVAESNDLALKDIYAVGAAVSIESLGDGAMLSQVADSRVELLGSNVALQADRVLLGENDSTNHAHHSTLNIQFSDFINTNESIALFDDFAPMPSSARIYSENGLEAIEVVGDTTIDLHAEFNNDILTIGHLRGHEATMSASDTQQTGPIHLSGALTFNGFDATLNHPKNDITFLQGTLSGPLSSFSYVDQNDVIIRDFLDAGLAAFADITSLGEGSTIRQAPNTSFTAGLITLNADNIELGADGRSDVLTYYSLDLNFSDNLVINGPYSLGSSTGPTLRIIGDDSDNDVFFGEHATTSPFSTGITRFDVQLGDGDDTMTFANDFIMEGAPSSIDIEMGDGDDLLGFAGDLVVRGDEAGIVNINMGNGDDWLMSAGEFLVDASTAVVNIDTGKGDDFALFLNGLTTTSSPSDDSQLTMGQGDDLLFFRNNLDVPATLGAGTDFVVAMDAGGDIEIVDFDPEEDYLVTTP